MESGVNFPFAVRALLDCLAIPLAAVRPCAVAIRSMYPTIIFVQPWLMTARSARTRLHKYLGLGRGARHYLVDLFLLRRSVICALRHGCCFQLWLLRTRALALLVNNTLSTCHCVLCWLDVHALGHGVSNLGSNCLGWLCLFSVLTLLSNVISRFICSHSLAPGTVPTLSWHSLLQVVSVLWKGTLPSLFDCSSWKWPSFNLTPTLHFL
jgi:hypothetical protein